MTTTLEGKIMCGRGGCRLFFNSFDALREHDLSGTCGSLSPVQAEVLEEQISNLKDEITELVDEKDDLHEEISDLNSRLQLLGGSR